MGAISGPGVEHGIEIFHEYRHRMWKKKKECKTHMWQTTVFRKA